MFFPFALLEHFLHAFLDDIQSLRSPCCQIGMGGTRGSEDSKEHKQISPVLSPTEVIIAGEVDDVDDVQRLQPVSSAHLAQE